MLDLAYHHHLRSLSSFVNYYYSGDDSFDYCDDGCLDCYIFAATVATTTTTNDYNDVDDDENDEDSNYCATNNSAEY